jgi:hypothetical protein
MNKLAMAITPVFAFGIVMTASATSISIKTDTHKSASPELLIIVQSNQSEVPEVVEGAFKRQDPDSIIRSTAEPDVDAVKSQPGAEPQPFKNKDPDSIIRSTAEPDVDAPKPQPGAEPQPFKDKAHSGMDNTLKRAE